MTYCTELLKELRLDRSYLPACEQAFANHVSEAKEKAARTGATHYVKDISTEGWVADVGHPIFVVLRWHDAVDLHGIQKGRIIYTASPEDAA